MNSPELTRYMVSLRNILLGASLLLVLLSWRLSVAFFLAGAAVYGTAWLLAEPSAPTHSASAE